MNTRVYGEVKFWRGIGWGIICVEGKEDVFVHYKDLPNGRGNLVPGQRVSFVPELNGTKGTKATNIRIER